MIKADNPQVAKERQKKVMLIINEFCNLDCTYCYEHHKTSHIMTFEIAHRVLDNELKDSDNYDEIEIEFIGGEAFLAFPLMKDIVDYVNFKYSNKPIHFYCTTNGTLIHGEIQEWLRENKNKFFCSLSLDGTLEMHDTNRPFKVTGQGSFDRIDIDFFVKNWDSINAKMTISPETLPYLAKGVKFIESQGFRCAATFATGIEWTCQRNIQILVEQLEELIAYYRVNPNREPCKMLAIELDSVFVPVQKNFRYCGAGRTSHAYDVHGNQYPCHGFAPITVGYDAATEFSNSDFSDFSLPVDGACISCKFIYMCPTCYASNRESTGDIRQQTAEMCIFNRLCALASSKIQYYRIIDKGIRNLTEEDQKTLKAISVIQSEIMKKGSHFLYNIS